MKNIFILGCLCATVLVAHAQQDTLFLDPSTGNFVIQYIGDADTIVTVIFEPATKVNPLLSAHVRTVQGTDSLIYQYAIANGENSKQNLHSFQLEYQADVVDATSNRWHSGKVTRFELRTFESGVVVDAMRWRWAGDQGLEPTWSVNGFGLKSIGLPGVVDAYFQGKVKVLAFPDYGPGVKVDTLVRKLRLFPSNRVTRRTVGPVSPPSPFVPLQFVDTIISHKHQALELGWIDNEGIAKSLEAKLENVKKQLERDNTKTAKNVLQAFLNEVEVQKDKHLSSEAYALMKYNGEFLLSKL